MKRVCVIGATSPLGVTLVPALTRAGYSVAASFRNESLIPGEWLADGPIRPFHLDLKSDEPLPHFECDAIVWLAHLDAGRFNEAEAETNLRAFDRVLSRVEGSDKFVFISSGGSVYGHAKSLPIGEEHERRPLSSYGIAKKVLEDRLIAFGSETDLSIAVLRPGNIYGFERPDRRTKGVTGAFLNAIAHNLEFTLVHGGRTVRDMIHVDDVCDAVELSIESARKNVIWNVGTGRGVTVGEILGLIMKRTGAAMPDLIECENFVSDVSKNVLSVEKIYSETGWSARIDLENGMLQTLSNWNLDFRSAVAND